LREDETTRTGDTGELEVAANFSRIGWGPVPNTRRDLGTDIFVQARDRRRFDLVLFVAVQVKTGKSFFSGEREFGPDGSVVGWWYYEEDVQHFDDWVTHGLPHLLVLHDLATRNSYWVHVTAPAITITGEGAKILVPATQTVDESNLDALIAVAATQKQGITFEGSVWRAAATEIPPARRLRTALITPRLVAPHRNTGFSREISPEEAIALLIQCRVRELEEFSKRHRKVPTFDEAFASRDWRWRLFACLAAAVVRGDYAKLKECIQRTNKQERKVAATVAFACWLMQDEKFDEAVTLLAGFGDRAGPIDHAWVLAQLSRAQAEVGDVTSARENAALALQGATGAAGDDPTASAIRSSAASLLYYTADFRDENLTEVVSTSDHAAAWWRTQSQFRGLADHLNRAFRRATDDQSRRFEFEEVAHNQLYSATLTSTFAGDHGSWSNATRLLAQNTLTLNFESGARDELANAIDNLRLSGSRSELILAAKHAWAWQPAEVLKVPLSQINDQSWSHTSASSTLALLQHAGDIAVTDQADAFVDDLLSIVTDPSDFVTRVNPTFAVSAYVLDALKGLVASCTESMQNKIAQFLAELPVVDDPALAVGYARVAARLGDTLLTAANVESLVAAASRQSDAGFSAQLLSLASKRSEQARAEIMRRIGQGDVHALSALGDVRKLSPADAKMLAERDAERLRQIMQEAEAGSFALWSHDSALSSAVIGAWFNEAVDWPLLAKFLRHPLVAGEHKRSCCIALANNAARLPEDARSMLLEVGPQLSDGPFDLILGQPLGGAGVYLFAALGAFNEGALSARITELITSSPEHRADSALMIGHLNRAELMPLAVGLLQDANRAVRLSASTSLAIHIVKSGDSSSQIAMAAVRGAIQSPGAAVALRVANAFYGEQSMTSSIARDLIRDLYGHESALVRIRVRHHAE